jgi:hypothetical protein
MKIYFILVEVLRSSDWLPTSKRYNPHYGRLARPQSLLILKVLKVALRERDMTVPKRIQIHYLMLVVVMVTSTFLIQPAEVQAQGDWRDLSADVDGDGLPNQVEDNGWYNATGGPYSTDYLDTDSDDDGLSDGKEKLYDTNPLDDRSPGIFVDYQSDLQTSQYLASGTSTFLRPVRWASILLHCRMVVGARVRTCTSSSSCRLV